MVLPLTPTQLYSTASYQAQNLQGIGLYGNNLTGWDFSGQNLTDATFISGTLTNANLTNADLTNANLVEANLTNANLTGATVAGVTFGGGINDLSYASNLTARQLYSTASYKTQNLQGINLENSNLTGWNFAGQNLTNANFDVTTLTDTNFTGADLRGAQFDYPNGGLARTTNAIFPDGTIQGLDLTSTNPTFLVRNYSGTSSIPIHVQQGMTLAPIASLVLSFDGNAWGSTISFDSGIPITLGGNLELDLVAGGNPASLVGDSFQVFDWTGVNPSGQFANITNDLPAGYAWDTSQLYTTGNVTLVPEPSTLTLLGSALLGLGIVYLRQRRAKA